jgi:hypothetical protein
MMEVCQISGSGLMAERFDTIIREYIDFVNRQISVYMDAMAGFENIRIRTERQVHRVRRRAGITTNEKGEQIMVWSSYEDPTKPDIIHNRIVRANEHMAANSAGGANERQHSQAILVFLVAYWESSIRPRLAEAHGVATNDVKSNVMGDLKIVRNAILHSKGIVKSKEHKRLRSLAAIFLEEREIAVPYEDMHKVFYMIKQDLARLMFDWLGVKDAPITPDQICDLAIQRLRHGPG